MKNSKKPSYMIPYQNTNLTTHEKTKILSKFELFEDSNSLEIESFAKVMNPKNIRQMEIFVEVDSQWKFTTKGI